MSKNIRDLIDLYEQKNKEQSEIESTIQFFTIKEQKLLIQELKQGKFLEGSLPQDVTVLKDIIQNQREQLVENENEVERLRDKIEQLIIDYEKKISSKKGIIKEDEDLLKIKKLVVQLTEENEAYKKQVEDLLLVFRICNPHVSNNALSAFVLKYLILTLYFFE